ncbi:hypothetical protein F5H01DRAFT_342686, partial [Linnemannia elongata]
MTMMKRRRKKRRTMRKMRRMRRKRMLPGWLTSLQTISPMRMMMSLSQNPNRRRRVISRVLTRMNMDPPNLLQPHHHHQQEQEQEQRLSARAIVVIRMDIRQRNVLGRRVRRMIWQDLIMDRWKMREGSMWTERMLMDLGWRLLMAPPRLMMTLLSMSPNVHAHRGQERFSFFCS